MTLKARSVVYLFGIPSVSVPLCTVTLILMINFSRPNSVITISSASFISGSFFVRNDAPHVFLEPTTTPHAGCCLIPAIAKRPCMFSHICNVPSLSPSCSHFTPHFSSSNAICIITVLACFSVFPTRMWACFMDFLCFSTVSQVSHMWYIAGTRYLLNEGMRD